MISDKNNDRKSHFLTQVRTFLLGLSAVFLAYLGVMVIFAPDKLYLGHDPYLEAILLIAGLVLLLEAMYIVLKLLPVHTS